MALKSYTITLTDEEREIANKIIADTTEDPLTVVRANVLLLSDSYHIPELSVTKIAELVGTSRQVVTKIRNVFHERGFLTAVHVLPNTPHERRANKNPELLCNVKKILSESPPSGRKRWSLRTLCSECTQRGYIDKISSQTMMRLLNKNGISLIDEK